MGNAQEKRFTIVDSDEGDMHKVAVEYVHLRMPGNLVIRFCIDVDCRDVGCMEGSG